MTHDPRPERGNRTLSLTEMRAQADAARQRLAGAGIDRDLEQRLAWKESRGVDTSVERRLLGKV